MMVIEMRQAAKDKAFELIDEIKDLGHQKKMAICELEDTLYDCFESSEDDEESEVEFPDMDDEEDVDFRRSKTSKYRRSMMRQHDDEDYGMRSKNAYKYRKNHRMYGRRMG